MPGSPKKRARRARAAAKVITPETAKALGVPAGPIHPDTSAGDGTPLAPPLEAKPPRVYRAHWTDEDKARACDTIIAAIGAGGMLKTVCDMDDTLPSETTFRGWVIGDGALAARYARAREARAHVFAEEVVSIADTEDDPQKARNRIDARKWAAKVSNRAAYGDQVDLSVTPGAATMDDRQYNITIDARMRPKLDKLFSEVVNPSVDDIINVFKVKELPKGATER